MKYDVIIIGGGPAGLSAAIYTSRANLSTLFLEKDAPGGKIVKTFKIENWTGDLSVTGPDLALRMFSHAQAFGAKYKYGDVADIRTHGPEDQEIILKNGEILNARNIIIATGMKERIPEDIINIQKLENKGVSYCAICDGPLYRDKPAIVIGGGNSAFEEALYLSQIASKVYVFIRSDKARADIISQKSLQQKENVEILYNSKVLELIEENNHLKKARVEVNGDEQILEVDHLYPYIGQIPSIAFAANLNLENKDGFIITDEHMQTSVKGVYAIGDIRFKDIRQIATAVADGAIAGKIIANRL